MINQLGPSEIERLKALILDGVATTEEIQTLREGLSDTIRCLADELQIPVKLLKKAISVSHKGNYSECAEDLADLEKILDAVGRNSQKPKSQKL